MVLPAYGWAKPALDARLTRLETIIENELNSGTLRQLDMLQQEISELRGKIEEQQNELQMLSKKQEKIFLNLDSRINKENKAEVLIEETAKEELNPELTPELKPEASQELKPETKQETI